MPNEAGWRDRAATDDVGDRQCLRGVCRRLQIVDRSRSSELWRAMEGHQLRFVHTGSEAVDGAGDCWRWRRSVKARGGGCGALTERTFHLTAPAVSPATI